MSKVYVVIGGFNYEGCDEESIKVFLNKEDAISYSKGDMGRDYDFVLVKEREMS